MVPVSLLRANVMIRMVPIFLLAQPRGENGTFNLAKLFAGLFSQILAFRAFTNLFFVGTEFEVKEKGVKIGLKNNKFSL